MRERERVSVYVCCCAGLGVAVCGAAAGVVGVRGGLSTSVLCDPASPERVHQPCEAIGDGFKSEIWKARVRVTLPLTL